MFTGRTTIMPKNNPNDSYTERKAIHEACGYSIALVRSFDSKQDNQSCYRVKKSFVMIKMKKINLKYIKKLRIIVIIQENLEELLIIFVI